MVAVREVSELVSQAHDKAAQDATRSLRKHALDSGWPSHLARALSVTHDNGKVSIDYPERHADEILDLEYGTQDRPPSPVLRTFNNRMDQHADLATHLETYLRGVL